MPPKTRRSPEDSPDHSTSQPDDPIKRSLDDQEEPARISKENVTVQDQPNDLKRIPTIQDRTNLPPTQPSTRTIQTQEPNKPAASSIQPSNAPPRPNLRTLIRIHLYTDRLAYLLADLQNLLYNDPERLRRYLEDPPARLSDRARQLREREEKRRLLESSDRQDGASSLVARQRRRSRSNDGTDGEDEGSGAGSESIARDESGGGEGEGVVEAEVRPMTEEEIEAEVDRIAALWRDEEEELWDTIMFWVFWTGGVPAALILLFYFWWWCLVILPGLWNA